MRAMTPGRCRPNVGDVIIAAALAGVIVLIAAGLIWAARLIRVGNLDAQALADKFAQPDLVSALDWPELRMRVAIPQPDGQPLVLLHVCSPAQPRRSATLLVALDRSRNDRRFLSLLGRWCTGQAPVALIRCGGAKVELRRHRSLQRVHAVLVAKDATPEASG